MKMKIAMFVLSMVLFGVSLVTGAVEESFLAAMIVMVFIGAD